MSDKEQTGFEFEPEYAVSGTGTKHEYNGLLLVPTPEELARIAEEERARDYAKTIVVGLSAPGHETKKVKMNPIEALRLRARGQ